VRGNIVGDASYFRGQPIGDGWQWNDLQWYFGAEASALTVNGNEINLNLLPPAKGDATPEVRSSDRVGYVQVDNRMAEGNRASRSTIGVARGLSDNRVEVWGELAPGAQGFGVKLSIHNPALWAARIFLAELKERNIMVDGDASARSSRSAPGRRFEPTQATEIASITSAPLSEIARATNKESNNLYAELILRTLGRERRYMLQTPDPPGRERGDDDSREVVECLGDRSFVSLRDLKGVAEKLETGSMPFFEPARRLYRSHGFQDCEPFADYKEDPNSVFMAKDLTG